MLQQSAAASDDGSAHLPKMSRPVQIGRVCFGPRRTFDDLPEAMQQGAWRALRDQIEDERAGGLRDAA
jgi:hypothetical protein